MYTLLHIPPHTHVEFVCANRYSWTGPSWKLWSVPFGPTITLWFRSIQMEVQSTQREQFLNGCFLLFPHSLSYFKIINFAPLSPNSSSREPHVPISKYWNPFPSEGPAEGKKKNKPPDGKYKPSAGVMHKIPDTFFFPLNKAFLLEGGKFEERSHTTQITYNTVICMNDYSVFFFLFLVLKNKLI